MVEQADKNINVMEFLPSFGDGGLERVIANYCQYVDKNKYSLFITPLFSFNKGECYKIAVNSGCKVHPILKRIKCWDGNLFIRVYKKLFSKKYIVSKLKKEIIKNKIKVIHAHNDVLQYLALMSDFLKENNIKLIYTCHSFPSRWLGEHYFEEHNAAIKLLNNNSLLICALHNKALDEIKSMFNTKRVIVLENPIDLLAFENDGTQKAKLRKQLHIPMNSYVIGDVCRLIPSKNISFLIDIFNECYKLDNSCFLLIACNENITIREELEQKINEYGVNDRAMFLINADIPDVLKTMDVFCAPSLIEGFSISLLEAQASRLNCVYSNINSDEINLTHDNIVLSLDNDAKTWGKAVLSLKNKSFSVKDSIRNYDVRNVITKIEALYDVK